eukprot:10374730-Lingulodinium_polyedra.AAC.1
MLTILASCTRQAQMATGAQPLGEVVCSEARAQEVVDTEFAPTVQSVWQKFMDKVGERDRVHALT